MIAMACEFQHAEYFTCNSLTFHQIFKRFSLLFIKFHRLSTDSLRLAMCVSLSANLCLLVPLICSTFDILRFTLPTNLIYITIAPIIMPEGVYPESDGSLAVVDIDASKGFVDLSEHLALAIFANFDVKKQLKWLLTKI